MNPPVQMASAPLPLGRAQRAALDALMDLLIPAAPDGRMPAARALGLYGGGQQGGGTVSLRAAERALSLRAVDRALFETGLAALDALAREAHGAVFAQLDVAQAKQLVEALRTQQPAFVHSFVTQTVGRYVAHPEVMPLLGLEARPPWPKGNNVAEGDWSLLDAVKQREKLYRKV